MPTHRLRASLTVLTAALVTVAGCGVGAVHVPQPQPATGADAVCAKLHDRLPAKLHGGEHRDTDPASDRTAAWGDPAIALRCGVPRPAQLRPRSTLAEVNKISWLPEPEQHPTRFTALGRTVYVEVTVPRSISMPAEVLSELTSAIKAAVPAKGNGRL